VACGNARNATADSDQQHEALIVSGRRRRGVAQREPAAKQSLVDVPAAMYLRRA
jgi:hypothetical protein